MFTNDKLNRRSCLKGLSLGVGGGLFAPLLQKVAAAANGNVTPPKRFIFFLFSNGFQESGAIPVGWKRGADAIRQESLKGAELPRDIAPFAPFQDRMTIVQGLQGRHCARGHAGDYGALAGVNSSAKSPPRAQTIDGALGKALPGIFPMVGLGIAGGKNTQATYGTSAWGKGSPISIQCRPELAYQSLFGSIGATGNDFLARKNLLDSISEDVRRLRSQIAGPERELVEHHFGALESLSKRDQKMSELQESGTLRRKAPKMPAKPPRSMVDVTAAQCDVAAAALISGLTNVVTITSGVGSIFGTDYSGISPTNTHLIGHGSTDPKLEVPGLEVLRRYREHHSTHAAGILKKLQETPEGKGTMLDNTVLVFTSDCANTQHCQGTNWPFVMVGDLGGTLKTGQYVSYPMSKGTQDGKKVDEQVVTPTDNPTINALYCTLLHAAGAPRDAFNAGAAGAELCGPLNELVV